ncbi:hypothetical protein [Pseudovibrio denitrificans]|uniref:hypothetical protein n=1 Tax=Pseudovibrio denitrificans TaxID=258256 RepID=UPI000B25A44E|nr:hypothetical protein [Pseudovibrio denitrificans]
MWLWVPHRAALVRDDGAEGAPLAVMPDGAKRRSGIQWSGSSMWLWVPHRAALVRDDGAGGAPLAVMLDGAMRRSGIQCSTCGVRIMRYWFPHRAMLMRDDGAGWSFSPSYRTEQSGDPVSSATPAEIGR